MNIDFYRKDRDGLFSVLKESWKQAETAWNTDRSVKGIDTGSIDNIIISGLGGSAISGNILGNFLRDDLKINLTVNRNYSLPAFADGRTLVIVSSYSGNTEETIAAFDDALTRGCPLIAVTTGGAIEKSSAEKGIPIVRMQPGFQPRYALYTSFFTILKIFQELGLVDSQESEVKQIIEMLRTDGAGLSDEGGQAYAIAEKLKGRVPVIYSIADLNDGAGRRFKGQFNENSKVHAWCAEYPEMNHNEVVGWETARESKIPYVILSLVDRDVHPRIAKRIEIINDLITAEKIDIITIEGRGESFKSRLIETIYLCDWISYYLALFNEKDPGEIDFIHHLKNKMLEV